MSTKKQAGAVKKSLWGIVVFYLLIAFEIFYMAGPFAVYFYGVYNPIQSFFNQSSILSTLNSFFLPHVARETSSVFINSHNYVGTVLAACGFIVFCIGACQIYYSKFTRKGAVTGGIYNFVRHPQYTSFAVCGFGLLILWPRYINLLMYTTMLFVYYLLAKAEEKECEGKFGQSYVDYKKRTSMFFPCKFLVLKKLPGLPKSRGKKALALFGMYISVLVIAFGIAKGVNTLAIKSLYAAYTDNTATISLCKIDTDKLTRIMGVALSDEGVRNRIDWADSNTMFLNYVLPTEWFAAEVPMNGVEYRAGHRSPSGYDDSLYKLIFTMAEIRGEKNVIGKDILTNVLKREPLIEVWIDLREQKVIQVLDIPDDYKYRGIPVAVY